MKAIGLALTLVFIFFLYLYNLDGWLLHPDENKYIYAAWRVAEGEIPGRDFIIAQPPLFLYVGAMIIRFFPSSPFPALYAVRFLSVITILISAVIIYRTATTIWNHRTGWLAMVIFLLNSQVYIQGRLFRPDIYMLLLTVTATYFFVRAFVGRSHTRLYLLAAGVLLGLASAAKLFGLFVWTGFILYLIARFLTGQSSVRNTMANLLTLGLAAFVTGGVWYLLYFYFLSPQLLSGVIGSHLRQGRPGLLLNLIKPLVLYSSLINRQFALLLIIPAIDLLRRRYYSPGAIFLWQLPTTLIFFLWTRSLYPRHLLYLIPTLAILIAWLLDTGLQTADNALARKESFSGLVEGRLLTIYRTFWRRGQTGVVIAGLVGLVVAQPLLGTIIPVMKLKDDNILPLVDYIGIHTGENDYVLAEYAGLNFFAQRHSVYHGPYISWEAASSANFTGNQLIDEIEHHQVEMVVFHIGEAKTQLNGLPDFDDFQIYVEDNFQQVSTFERVDQIYDIGAFREINQTFGVYLHPNGDEAQTK